MFLSRHNSVLVLWLGFATKSTRSELENMVVWPKISGSVAGKCHEA